MWQIIFDGNALTIDFDPIPQFAFGLLGDVGQTNNFVTREITIKKSPEANALFEHINLPNISSDFAKREHVIHLTYNSAVILQNARLESFKVDKDQYKIILAAWNRNLTEILSGKLSTLDWYDYNLPFDGAPQVDEFDTSGYALFKYTASVVASVSQPCFDKLLPFITFKGILENILAKNMLNLVDFSQADILNNNQLIRSAFQMTTRRPPITTDFFSVGHDGFQTIHVVTSPRLIYDTATFTNSGVYSFFNVQDSPTVNQIIITNTFDFKIKLNLTSLDTSTLTNGLDSVVVFIYDDLGNEVKTITRAWNGVSNFNQEILIDGLGEMGANWRLQIGFAINIFITDHVDIRINEFSGTTLGVSEISESGATYSFQNNLPDITQLQFFETVLNMFGLFCDYDAPTRTIVLTDYQYYKDRFAASEYLDWSDKICNYQNGVDIDETGAFAKKNTYRYTNKSPIADEYAGYDLLFANNNVPETKSAYKAPFPVWGADSTSNFHTVAPYLIPNTEVPPVWEYQSVDPFFAVIGVNDPTLAPELQFNQLSNYYATLDASIFWADLIERQTDYLAEINDYKVFELEAKLTDQDILNITKTDIRYPVVLNVGMISGVFKINWIKYRAKGISEISLFKLNG